MRVTRSRRSLRSNLVQSESASGQKISTDVHDANSEDEDTTTIVTNTDDSIAASSSSLNNDDDNSGASCNIDNEEEEISQQTYLVDGIEYKSYSEMVAAKRNRNQKVLVDSGLLSAAATLSSKNLTSSTARNAGGITPSKKKKKRALCPSLSPAGSRKSSRIAGVEAININVESEKGGRITVSNTTNGTKSLLVLNNKLGGYGGFGGAVKILDEQEEQQQTCYMNRINDGSDITPSEAVLFCEDKWIPEEGTDGTTYDDCNGIINSAATRFVHNELKEISNDSGMQLNEKQHKSIKTFSSIDNDREFLSETKREEDVAMSTAKVTPERIFSITCHPSRDHVIVCAGDKVGYVGMWKQDENTLSTNNITSNDDSAVSLFKLHNRPVSNLQWNNDGSQMTSISYDGSVRRLDANHTGTFQEVFATYNSSTKYRDKIGHGFDDNDGKRATWLQYGCLDPRNQEQGMFLSTSRGTVFHVDLRSRRGKNGGGDITMHQTVSEKKVNSVSLHSNGTTLATAGLDAYVKLWDIRKFSVPNKTTCYKPMSSSEKSCLIYKQNLVRSVSSAFFSNDGQHILATGMSNTLNVITNAHLKSTTKSIGEKSSNLSQSIKHNTQTGRWLSTFMAQWHPSRNVFVVGSMAPQPRRMEIFGYDNKSSKTKDMAANSFMNARTIVGNVEEGCLTSVVSRCCFHPSEDEMIVCGGSSSGRVTVCRL